MKKYIFKRFLQLIPVVVIVAFFSFFVINAAPGSPIDNYIRTDMTPEEIQELKVQYGVDGNWVEQFLGWGKRTIRGDLGLSIYKKKPVTELIGERLPSTMILAGTSLVISLVLAIPISILSAKHENNFIDNIISFFSYFGISVPQFWLGMILIILFSVKLKILPSGGIRTVNVNTTGDFLKHLIMPAIVMSLNNLAIYIRYLRSSILTELQKDYVETAVARGGSEKALMYKHILRNSMLPIVTLLGVNITSLVTGSVVIETVFSWPGIGKLAMDAINQRDFPVIMGYTMFSCVVLILGNFLADILYAYLNPKIRKSIEAEYE